MKILELSPSLAPGGAERFTVDLSNELAKNHDVTILVMRKFQNSDFYKNELSEKLHYIQENGTFSKISKLLQLFKVLYWIFRLKPDIVHAHTIGVNWLFLPSFLYPKAKYFFTIHNLANQECTTKLGFHLRSFLFRRNVKAISISNVCYQSFKDFFGFPCFANIDNGCREIETTDRLPETIREMESYKVNADTKVFVNIARIMPQKNHQLLIKSFNQFVKQGNNAVLLIIGDYKHYPEAKKELDKLVNTERIHFLGTRNNVADYLFKADYFCLSSAWEGLPISLLEAGLSGCYPISTPAGGVVDVIINESWGIITKDFTEESYLKALDMAYTIKYDKEEIRKLYYSKFSMKVCAEKYNNLFQKHN